MFNIADGGFTELHIQCQNEEKAAVPGTGHGVTTLAAIKHNVP